MHFTTSGLPGKRIPFLLNETFILLRIYIFREKTEKPVATVVLFYFVDIFATNSFNILMSICGQGIGQIRKMPRTKSR